MGLSIIKLLGACSLLLLVSCSSSSTEELVPENQTDGGTSSNEQINNDTVSEQEIDSGTSTDTNPEANSANSEPDPALLAKNIYANGFRLSKATNTFGSRVLIRNYEYDFSNNEILITKSIVGEEDASEISRLYIDRSGRLVGGSFEFEAIGPTSAFISDYDFLYDEEGNVIEYFDSPDNVSTFNYVGGLLDNVAYRLLNTIYTHRFTYDAQGVRTSSQDGVSGTSTQFEYNTLGQLSRAVGINQSGRQFMAYELEYDVHGNHISTTKKFIDGEVLTTDVFTYEVSPETVFNHGIIRQKIQAFDVTSARYVR